MKKFFLVVITFLPTLLSAQNGVTISNFSVSAVGSVTLDISWKADGMPPVWLDSAWVFVDYNDGGVMKRLPLLPGATILNPSAQGAGYGIVIEEAGNNQGVWVVGKTRGTLSSFSATVVLPFNPATDVKGACGYASNYPPFGAWNDDGTILSITGTPPYILQLQNSASTETITTGSPYMLHEGYTLQAFTDQTGAPGMLHCTPPTAPTSLTASSTTICSGASVLLTAEGGQEGSKSQFEWGTGSVGTGGSLTSSNTYLVSPASTTNYWVRRVSSDGCGTTTETTRTVTVIDNPSIPTPTIGSNTCEGTGLTFSTTTPGGATGVEWTGAVSGTGSPKTTATTAGTYSAQVRSYLTVGTLTCTSAYSTATSGTVNALPTPSFTDGKTQGCAGSVVAVTANAGGSYCFALTNTTCNPINTTATYDVPMPQAGNQAVYVTVKNVAGCTATTSKTLTGLSVPAINYLSGNTYQTVASGTAIAAIKYTTTGATTVTVANLPTGITANWASNTVTISGTSSATGTKGYTVTASNTNLCPSATATGTITIASSTPPYAASTQTWTVGTQVWSAPIKVPACSGTAFTYSTTVPYCRNSADYPTAGYFYNTAYVIQNASTLLCPQPWRVPSCTDYNQLVNVLGSNFTKYTDSTWGGCYGGQVIRGAVSYQNQQGIYATSADGTASPYSRFVIETGQALCQSFGETDSGRQVRCVK